MMKRTIRFTWTVAVVGALVGLALLAGAAGPTSEKKVQRYGMVIGVKPEKLEYYKQLHAETWPGVLKQISQSNIQNYSIYLKELEKGRWYLFSYFEYTGDDFEADMEKMGEDDETQRWWKETDPCQIPIATREKGEWWSRMEEVFYHP
jgi:L-rhamnose mutarotase